MNLVRSNWLDEDIKLFKQYELSFLGDKKDCEWEQRIVNTKLQCFGKTSGKAKKLVKEIKKGNYLEFIDHLKIENHLESLIVAFLISSIKDFGEFESKLDNFVKTIDNWASTDTLRFQKKDRSKLKLLSIKYLKSSKPFIRRTGLNIYFELIHDHQYLKDALEVIESLKNEQEYYVNMCAAWLLADCFAKYRDETLSFFEVSTTNSFIINKAISKCRDSFRVSKEDKDYLLKFKRK